MKIFIAGASGVIGRPILAQLGSQGHDITAITRSEAHAEQIRAGGAKPVVVDVFDRPGLRQAVEAAKPDVIIHQLTSLPDRIDPRHVKQALAQDQQVTQRRNPNSDGGCKIGRGPALCGSEYFSLLCTGQSLAGS